MEDSTNFSTELFEGKTLSDLFKNIYENHTSTKHKIKELIESLIPLVEGIGDATLLVPLIKEYLEIGVKNDEQLVKLAQIVQRMDSGKKGISNEFDFSDLEGLVAEQDKLEQNIKEIKQDSQEEVKS